ncbi:type II secretion system protein [Candidatus Saccharibacteria bacterium]|nr:type II secretion system protein [Candidatus Saccharibacteria bacterium]
MKTQSNKNGFTIIEVVLVLAIAGLIFLIVFLALPALQRSQRDTQRRGDASRMLSQLEAYAGNRNGNYPSSTAQLTTFINTYMTNGGQSFQDPQGSNYTVQYRTYSAGYTAPTAAGRIDYITSAACNDSGNGNNVLTAGAGNRSVAVVTYLEQGGYFCQDNK